MTTASEHIQEFTCIECRRDIIRFCGHGKLCGMCLHMPGWFRHPEIREMLDPDHDGGDPAEQEESANG